MSTPQITSFPSLPPFDNLGGCRVFNFAPVESVLAIPRASGIILNNDVLFKNGFGWLEAYSTPDTLKFSERMNENLSGKHFLTEITGFYPKLSPENTGLFRLMRFNRFIVKVKDNNDHWRLCGTVENPLEFAFDQSTGASTRERNGHTFRFFGEQKEESPFLVID
jgi:hypothetical protein